MKRTYFHRNCWKKVAQIDRSHAMYGYLKNRQSYIEKLPPLDHGRPEMKCTYFHRNCWKKQPKMIGRMPWVSQESPK